ncbi:LytR C-terminal domain-containing protein [Nocardioides campestrisoli]|uniref:LytR C-terminal domain-containing protein n=1 Tax=Nocardioides campestrisoli TaxID=2736757 RepID=UPI00163D8538|nr:LytR C-terminal domain-containing protein [Nocardioides campestrisoli]
MKRDERGVAYPSPLVMLSVIAVAMAGVAFVATKDQPEQERRVETVASTPTPTTEAAPEPAPAPEPPPEPEKPAVERGKIYVEVYNNTGIKGLAASTAEKISGAGWQVVGTDNWVGTIPAPTVYFPQRLKAAAELLALDLGFQRVQPAVAPMKQDRLTVILTG